MNLYRSGSDVGWLTDVPAFQGSLTIVAPHPDDEVLGAAGLMTWLAASGVPLEIVAVTDGEASHARSTAVTGTQLVAIRAAERTAALETLGVAHVPVVRLGLPDGAVEDHIADLARTISDRIGSRDTLILPAETDNHPDHLATWRAGRRAALAREAAVFEMPVWTRVTIPEPPPSAHVLRLGPDGSSRKRLAVACFKSQLQPVGDGPWDGPVLHPHEVAAMTTDHEWLLP